jgi:NAD(P)-dependent dehydrogenase (short-subunit alcohol dehydrogenase family)
MTDERTHEGAGLAVVTGASLGLGAALSAGLVAAGWSVVIDARESRALAAQARRLEDRAFPGATVEAVAGDVTDPAHRAALVAAVARHGALDLLVNNASTLGPSPLPTLADLRLEDLRDLWATNVEAPLALMQGLAGWLAWSRRPRILNVTSDAGVEPYERWGGYGTSKAALERLGAGWAAENPTTRVWAVDSGDLRTRMHQEAFPGEDISDRPEPATVVPALLRLINSDEPSGRINANSYAESVS